MDSLLLWRTRPALSLLVLWMLSQVFLYAARVPMHRALRNVGKALGGSFRLAARFCKGLAAELGRRRHEMQMEAGRTELQGKIEKEFHKIEGGFTKELAQVPAVHRKLDDIVTKLEADYKECGSAVPAAPGWTEALNAVSKMPQNGDRVVQKLLEEIHKTAVSGEKKATAEFREATSQRHKILGGMAVQWKELKNLTSQVGKSVAAALDTTKRVDGYMTTYEQVRKQDAKAVRALGWQSTQLFVVSLIVMAIAVGGAFVNFNLIALPMSELVPSGNRIAGLPVASIAALVLVLMETASGLFAMETLGITNLFPKLELLPASRRRLILFVSVAGLFLLAGIECSLAVLREQIVESATALKQSLAGSAPAAAVAHTASSRIPVIGQAVLGFILPWILAMVAVPLETLIATGGQMALGLVGGALSALGVLARLVGHGASSLMDILRYLYDVYIVLPLQAERMVRGEVAVASGAGDKPLRGPFELAAKETRR